MAAFARLPVCSDAEEAEARAMLFGINAIKDLSWSSLIIELDCAVVANALRSRSPDKSLNWATIEEAKLILGQKAYNISTIRRSANAAADSLA